MANVKQGNLTRPGEWWKHLRWTKRTFWHGERKAWKDEIKKQVKEPSWPTDTPSDSRT